MSAASQIFEQSADVLGVVHNDALVLMPGDIAVSGYAQLVGQDPELFTGRHRQALHLNSVELLVTHIVHIRRREIVAKGVDLKSICEIRFASGESYRVRHFVDDAATSPDVDFYCLLQSV